MGRNHGCGFSGKEQVKLWVLAEDWLVGVILSGFGVGAVPSHLYLTLIGYEGRGESLLQRWMEQGMFSGLVDWYLITVFLSKLFTLSRHWPLDTWRDHLSRVSSAPYVKVQEKKKTHGKYRLKSNYAANKPRPSSAHMIPPHTH